MEDVTEDHETTGEAATAGNGSSPATPAPEEEKLLPAGHNEPAIISVPVPAPPPIPPPAPTAAPVPDPAPLPPPVPEIKPAPAPIPVPKPEPIPPAPIPEPKQEAPVQPVPVAPATEKTSSAPEKDPASTPAISVAPWTSGAQEKLRAADMLHGGNAVAAFQKQQGMPGDGAPMETPLERNLREVGLKEALPHQGAEPARDTTAEETAPEKSGIQRIHTYAADMSEEMKKRGSTLGSIITAEKARVEENPQPVPVKTARGRRGILLIGAFFFIVVGAGAIVTVLFFSGSGSSTPQPVSYAIPVNSKVTVATEENVPLSQTLAKARAQAQISLGNIEAFDITNNGVSLTAGEILTALRAPDVLVRNAESVLVGVHAFNHTQPFLIISVSAYDLSFKAMLEWEKAIGDNLGNFFAPDGIPADNISVHAPALVFGDRVSANVDVRASQGEWPIIYSFPRQNLLIITTNENTLREIMTRLSLQSNSNQ